MCNSESSLITAVGVDKFVIVETKDAILVSPRDRVQDVKKIVSVPQALAQCKNWLRHKFKTIEILETSSTSQAARIASEDHTSAAIASRQSAHMYDLQIVESKIEDYSGNITRFLIIGNETQEESLKDKRVRNKIARANSCKNIPMVCIKKESDKGVINHSGKTRKGIGYTGLKISIIYNPTAKINRR